MFVHGVRNKFTNDCKPTSGQDSFWIIDDLTPLHQLSKEIADKEVYLYEPMPSYRMAGENGGRGVNRKLEGENHPGGVTIHYFLKTVDDSAEVKLDILDMDGKVIKSFSTKAKEPADLLKIKKGGNSFVWNMRYPGYKTFPGMVYYGSPNQGPKAVPGQYKVRLTNKEHVVEQSFEIFKDPRIATTPEDFQAQFDFLLKVRDKVSEANQQIIDIRKTKDDMSYLKKKIGAESQYKDLAEAIKKFESELTVIENNIHQTKNRSVQDPLNYGIKLNNRLAFLMIEQGQVDYRPNKQAEEVRMELTKKIDTELAKLRTIMDANITTIKKMIKEKGIEMVM